MFFLNSNRVDVLGHKYVFGPPHAHFNPRYARAKMILSRAKNIIYARERQLYCYIIEQNRSLFKCNVEEQHYC